MRAHRRAILATVATVALLGSLAWYWQASLLPETYSVMDMGYADYGGGPTEGPHAGDGVAVSVPNLTGPQNRPADVAVTLTTRQESFELGSDGTVNGYTVNGTSPGPTIQVVEGDLVEVRVVNESVSDGVALHWHGVDVPNAEDGVAGVTQDAIGLGDEYLYRFVAERAGSYWYHSHQVSHEQVRSGLFGALVIRSRGDVGQDIVTSVHTYDGIRTINGAAGETHIAAQPDSRHRVRLINTDNGPLRAEITGAAYRVLAVDGYSLHDPTSVEGQAVVVTAGGRVDLEVTTPADGSAAVVAVGGGTSLVLGGEAGAASGAPELTEVLDLLSYGSPAPIGFDPDEADRHFEYRIGDRIGLFDGRPGRWWTINGQQWPDVPMYMVAEGDIVRMTLSNDSGEVHPMHLHGHHAVVLSRNGEPATGSPWWVDSLNVEDGETYEIAFVADNPGIWMDHCHNLPHAAEGLVAHLMYTGVTTPFVVGGDADNAPE